MNKSFHNLMVHSLRDMYDAEKQILKALPKMTEAASSEKLQKGFIRHQKQTEEHVRRIEQIAEEMGFDPAGVPCAGMAGLIKEGDEIMKMALEDQVKDAALIVAAQKVEHYEMVVYASMITHAELMGHTMAVELLKKTLTEEKQTDSELNTLAESDINEKAAGESRRGQGMSHAVFHG